MSTVPRLCDSKPVRLQRLRWKSAVGRPLRHRSSEVRTALILMVATILGPVLAALLG